MELELIYILALLLTGIVVGFGCGLWALADAS